jgi:outer membrane protein OmpA-like peptidoglycan-associated protein
MIRYLLISFLCAFTLSAHAVNLQKFHFSNSPGFATLEDGLLTDGLITTNYKYILITSYNYVRAPFIEIDGSKRSNTIIEWMHTMNLGGAYRFNDSFQVGISTFITKQKAQAVSNSEQDENISLGDTTLDFKYKLFEKNRFAVSFTPKLYLSTGNKDYYTSNAGNGYYLGFAIDKAFSFVQLVANVGHKENADAREGDLDHRRQFHLSLGAIVPLFGGFDITTEFYRDTPYDSNNEQIPSEANVGLRYHYDNETALYAGLGTGSLEESESTDMRVYAGIKFFPSKKKVSKKIATEEQKYGKFYKMQNIYFATASSKLDKVTTIYLSEIVQRLKEDSMISKIVLEGYASQKGNKEKNLKLSERRSKSVKKYLIENGVDMHYIEIVGYGDVYADKSVIDKDIDRKVMIRIYRKR